MSNEQAMIPSFKEMEKSWLRWLTIAGFITVGSTVLALMWMALFVFGLLPDGVYNFLWTDSVNLGTMKVGSSTMLESDVELPGKNRDWNLMMRGNMLDDKLLETIVTVEVAAPKEKMQIVAYKYNFDINNPHEYVSECVADGGTVIVYRGGLREYLENWHQLSVWGYDQKSACRIRILFSAAVADFSSKLTWNANWSDCM